jgi:hypothetical protein
MNLVLLGEFPNELAEIAKFLAMRAACRTSSCGYPSRLPLFLGGQSLER